MGPLGTIFSDISNPYISIQENALANVVCEMASTFSWPQCVNILVKVRVRTG